MRKMLRGSLPGLSVTYRLHLSGDILFLLRLSYLGSPVNENRPLSLSFSFLLQWFFPSGHFLGCFRYCRVKRRVPVKHQRRSRGLFRLGSTACTGALKGNPGAEPNVAKISNRFSQRFSRVCSHTNTQYPQTITHILPASV